MYNKCSCVVIAFFFSGMIISWMTVPAVLKMRESSVESSNIIISNANSPINTGEKIFPNKTGIII